MQIAKCVSLSSIQCFCDMFTSGCSDQRASHRFIFINSRPENFSFLMFSIISALWKLNATQTGSARRIHSDGILNTKEFCVLTMKHGEAGSVLIIWSPECEKRLINTVNVFSLDVLNRTWSFTKHSSWNIELKDRTGTNQTPQDPVRSWWYLHNWWHHQPQLEIS